ncbi:DUF998 domain-containing protein [Microbispora triticiradicis]|uniref:DUF998 domain-containing protein n=1 Tax=Microbispora triticiradicis TaxID=2200763 RepID=UPI001AD75EDD|nr:DUF998 domain-containing protein [Microbispora triticiradicis]MBO4270349.1 DUF998 domain-containing protein [Microbispora triticiradicis]
MSDSQARARTRLRTLLACGFAPLLFLLVILADGALQPGYDSIDRWGSELSNGEWGWVQIANFVITGLLTAAFAVGVRRSLGSGPGSRAIPVFTGILGFCLIVGGVFVTDPNPGFPPGVQPPAEPTLHAWIHNLNLFPAWAALTVAILMAAYRAMSRKEGAAWTLITLAAGVLTPLTLYVAARHFDWDTRSGHSHGLWQRVSQGIGFGWYAVYATRLLRGTMSGRGPRPTSPHE